MNDLTAPIKMCLEDTLRILDGNAERFNAIAAVVIQDLPMLVEELVIAVAANDSNLAKQMLHSIKGIGSNFQAEPLTQLAEKLCREYDSLSYNEIGTLISEIAEASEGTVFALSVAIERYSA